MGPSEGRGGQRDDVYTAKFSDFGMVTHALVEDRRASLLAWQARRTRR
jgi:hypothetical protein